MTPQEKRKSAAWEQRDRYWYRPIPGTRLWQCFRFEKDGSIIRYQLCPADNRCTCPDTVSPCKHLALLAMHQDHTMRARMKVNYYLDTLEQSHERNEETAPDLGRTSPVDGGPGSSLRKPGLRRTPIKLSRATIDAKLPPCYRKYEFPRVAVVEVGITSPLARQGFLNVLIFHPGMADWEIQHVLRLLEVSL